MPFLIMTSWIHLLFFLSFFHLTTLAQISTNAAPFDVFDFVDQLIGTSNGGNSINPSSQMLDLTYFKETALLVPLFLMVRNLRE